jgi:hypothetical protein
MTTTDQLADIEARADAATDGPWNIAVSEDRKWALVLADAGTADERIVVRSISDDDAEFIAHARTDIPALLAMVREQRERLDTADALIRDLTDSGDCSFDHHGGCQAHGYLSLEPGETCPQQDAKDWARAALTATEGAE